MINPSELVNICSGAVVPSAIAENVLHTRKLGSDALKKHEKGSVFATIPKLNLGEF